MFGLNGIGGMLIAVVLLISIVGFLGTNALLVQQKNASNYYKIEAQKDIPMIDKATQAKVVDAK
jgi:hypothetical protein